ncbi:MAG: hypothetical protein ACJATG_000906, partial [Dinoroseobacter sp.]
GANHACEAVRDQKIRRVHEAFEAVETKASETQWGRLGLKLFESSIGNGPARVNMSAPDVAEFDHLSTTYGRSTP